MRIINKKNINYLGHFNNLNIFVLQSNVVHNSAAAHHFLHIIVSFKLSFILYWSNEFVKKENCIKYNVSIYSVNNSRILQMYISFHKFCCFKMNRLEQIRIEIFNPRTHSIYKHKSFTKSELSILRGCANNIMWF